MSGHAAVQTQTATRPTLPPVASGMLQRQCACGQHTSAGGECEECKQKREGILQRAAVSGSSMNAVPPIVHEVLRSSGRPLDPGTRAFMEPHFEHDFSRVPPYRHGSVPTPAHLTIGAPHDDFEREAELMAQQITSRSASSTGTGYDFSGVRIHTNGKAAESARAVNALAYTVGRDIVFGAGRFAPETSAGRRLLAHELTHVVQQGDCLDVPRVRRKVVDDNDHLPCRAVAGRGAAVMTSLENDAATLAENAAAAVRATPLAEPTRALAWKRFRLDYNDPLARCRFLPEIGDRFARIAREIRNTDCTYSCTATGEPSSECSTALGVTHVGMLGGQRIDLCSGFWAAGPDQQALTLLHEWAHYVFSTRGLNDELPGGFDTAECYNAFASELAGQPISGPEDTNCVPNTRPLPALDRGRLHVNCQANVFLNLSVTGGYAYGLPGSNQYLTTGAGLDYLFPLTRLHDWELAIGARFLHFAPTDSGDRNAYLLGVRAALAFRYRPWRFGGQFGSYIEGGGVNVPVGSTGSLTHPYGAVGISGGVNFRIGRQTALQILGEVGGGVSLDTQDERHFGWFQSGLSVVLQFQ